MRNSKDFLSFFSHSFFVHTIVGALKHQKHKSEGSHIQNRHTLQRYYTAARTGSHAICGVGYAPEGHHQSHFGCLTP